MNRLLFTSMAFVAVLLTTATPVQAGGYDTPMLYSARHMGMGGAAVGYVSDPSAMFHNPAGLAHIEGSLSLLGDVSLLLGTIQGSPDTNENHESELTVAPFFLVGAGGRITDWLTWGFAIYPVASSGANYQYAPVAEDSTKLVFIEASPGLAVNIDAARLRIGAGYRLTYVSLSRVRRFESGGTPFFDFSLTGINVAGFRVGAQWDAVPEHLSIGLTYRHRTTTEVSADSGTILVANVLGAGLVNDLGIQFTLPSRLVLGVRGDFSQLGVAMDLEYGFNSQNDQATLSGNVVNRTTGVRTASNATNYFEWQDALTVRVGAEYRIELDGTPERGVLTPRLGYVFDAQTSNRQYPTAFGTPPAPTQVLTAGVGYDGGPWEANLAYARRFGGTDVTQAEVDAAANFCAFCGKVGTGPNDPAEYAISLHGIYLDFSYDFD